MSALTGAGVQVTYDAPGCERTSHPAAAPLASSSGTTDITEPSTLFDALPSKADGYGYLRAVQKAVLDAWSERRDEHEVVIKTNTGGGKTIVGLLMLQCPGRARPRGGRSVSGATQARAPGHRRVILPAGALAQHAAAPGGAAG